MRACARVEGGRGRGGSRLKSRTVVVHTAFPFLAGHVVISQQYQASSTIWCSDS